MKEEEWKKQLRERLADYEAPVPADLWAGIEAELDKRQSSKRRSRIIPLWVKWTAAASLTAFLLSGGYLLWPAGNEPLAETTPEKVLVSSSQKEEAFTTPHQEKPVQQTARQEKPACQIARMEKPVQQETFFQESDTNLTASLEHQDSPNQDQQEKTETPVHELSSPQDVIHELEEQITQISHQHHSHLAFSLYASNGFGSQQHLNGVLMSASQLANYAYSRSATRGETPLVWLYNYGERQKHYQPISLGLTTSIPISSRLSVSTGLVYTRLRSDFTNIIHGYPIHQEQTLLYLGIPVSLQYRLWHLRRFKVYAAAGGQADFSIYTKFVSQGSQVTFDNDRPQFSLNGSLGLQYDFLPQLGIYVEPGVKHYFDNGSKIRNFFKDKPTDFNLQVGLRINL